MEGLLNGFPVGQSLTAAASRSLYLLLGLSLPVLAFASLTRNMAELVIGAVLGSLGFVLFKVFINLINNYGEIGPVMATGLSWIRESTMFAVAVVGSSTRSEEHTSELQSLTNLVCRLLLEKKKKLLQKRLRP